MSAERGHSHRGKRKEIARRVERPKKWNSKAPPVSQGIEDAMGCGRQEKVEPDRASMKREGPNPHGGEHSSRGQESGKEKRMSESAVTEQIAGAGAKGDCDHVEIGRERTRDSESKQAAWNSSLRKSRQKRRGGYAMGKDGRHPLNLTQSRNRLKRRTT